MYPLETGLVYARNLWYVGALSTEVDRKLMERKILGDPVVFYRTEAGLPVAIAGLCPHRLYPMVRGTLIGDAVECSYHGITYDCTGRCTRIPSQATVPSNFSIRAYPVAERQGWIWIWMGDPALADESLIPNPDCLHQPGFETTVMDVIPVPARYQLLIDNLFDLSHIDFLHRESIPPTEASSVQATLEDTPDGNFRVRRCFDGAPYDPYAAFIFGPGSGPSYFNILTDYLGPALSVSGSVHNRQPGQGTALGGGSLRYLHALTPETPTSTHYFPGFSRDFHLEDAAADAAFMEQLKAFDHRVRVEDADGLALIESHLATRSDSSKELSVIADAGAIRVRRLLSAQIKAEQQA